jgi:hypothetical protein
MIWLISAKNLLLPKRSKIFFVFFCIVGGDHRSGGGTGPGQDQGSKGPGPGQGVQAPGEPAPEQGALGPGRGQPEEPARLASARASA